MSYIGKAKSPLELAVPRQDKLLEQYYDRLQGWALLLTRGDVGKSQDIVHELCLHLALTNPDLNRVKSLDGYLYTCLRHIYLSDIARSAREALQIVSPDEFDSIQIAFRSQPPGDPLQQQNDLRRVCAYLTWRKALAKSASYLILRFFHGYYRREVATIAGVPLSTIDPKLNKARSEVHLYLLEPGKLQFTSRELPPPPRLHWTPLSSMAVFKELRETILAAREGECLPEEELLAHYRNPQPAAISCPLLSHIVSCERCLSLIDFHFRRPTLKDREPLDSLDSSPDPSQNDFREANREAMFRSVRRYGNEIVDHRPRTLSIAVDGKILASRDVQSESSMLSARIEHPENASFIEVFSEQGIRLALLSLFELPPEGPHQRIQRVTLSDARWLELTLTFDGLGLNSEVLYFDPALAAQMAEDDTPEPSLLQQDSDPPQQPARVLGWPGGTALIASIRRILRSAKPSPVMGWATVVACLFLSVGYFVYLNEKPITPLLSARQILDHAIQIEATELEGQTEHQVLRFEQASVDGNVLDQGSIDLWKDGDDKRQMRRLYDAKHRLVAAEWIESNGEHGQYQETGDAHPSAIDRELLADDLWKQDISPTAFRGLNGENAEIRPTEEGYTLTAEPGAAHPQLISATLVLDRHFHPIREVMRVRSENGIHEVRFVEADYERRPSASVPDTIFDPRDQGLRSRIERRPLFSGDIARDVQSTELDIAVLYQLYSLNADTSDPIEVQRMPNEHIRVIGTVASDDRKQQILSRLSLLNNHQLLETQLTSPSDLQKRGKGKKSPRTQSKTVSIYDVGQTEPLVDAVLHAHFEAQGLSGVSLNDAVSSFSREALGHSQRALQNAFALKRLSNTSSQSDLRYLSLTSQQQWTEMVAKHATALEEELRALREQLSQLSASSAQLPSVSVESISIESPAQFARVVNQLLVRIKNLDQNVSSVFASSQTREAQPVNIQSLIAATTNSIPLQQTVAMTSFAIKLNLSARTIANRQHSRLGMQIPERP